MQTDSLEPLVTCQQAAKAFNVHPWQIRRLVKNGSIPKYAPFNGRRYVRLSEVAAFIESRREAGAK